MPPIFLGVFCTFFGSLGPGGPPDDLPPIFLGVFCTMGRCRVNACTMPTRLPVNPGRKREVIPRPLPHLSEQRSGQTQVQRKSSRQNEQVARPWLVYDGNQLRPIQRKRPSARRRSDDLRSLVMAAGYQGALIWPGQNRGNIQTEDVGELYRRERPKAV